jgi:hypothetical protein
MISAEAVRSIISQYERFGWQLRKVLLRPQLRDSIAGEMDDLFGTVEVIESDIDAAWFTRESKGGGTAWELRALHDSPFALIEVVDADVSDSELDEVLGGIEQQLRERRWSRGNGN